MSEARQAELLELAVTSGGGNEEIITSGTVTVTSGYIYAIQVVDNSVISAQTNKGQTNADLTAFSLLPAGTWLYGKWSSITLASGAIIVHKGS